MSEEGIPLPLPKTAQSWLSVAQLKIPFGIENKNLYNFILCEKYMSMEWVFLKKVSQKVFYNTFGGVNVNNGNKRWGRQKYRDKSRECLGDE